MQFMDAKLSTSNRASLLMPPRQNPCRRRRLPIYLCKWIYMYIYIYVSIYWFICMCIYIGIYTYIYIERERERESERERYIQIHVHNWFVEVQTCIPSSPELKNLLVFCVLSVTICWNAKPHVFYNFMLILSFVRFMGFFWIAQAIGKYYLWASSGCLRPATDAIHWMPRGNMYQ